MKKDIYKKELYDLIVEIETFSGNFLNDVRKGFIDDNKTAMKRARVNSILLTKLFKELRKKSIEDEKQYKENK